MKYKIVGIIAILFADAALGMDLGQLYRRAQEEVAREQVLLISADEKQFRIFPEVAQQSPVLSDILSHMQGEETKTIPFSEIDGATLAAVVKIMQSADMHKDLVAKALLQAMDKDVPLKSDQIVPVLKALNFLDCMAGVRLIAYKMSRDKKALAAIEALIRTSQLSDNTIKEIGRIYYLLMRTDLKSIDENQLTFSVRDYLEYQPGVIPDRTWRIDEESLINLSNLRLGSVDGLDQLPYFKHATQLSLAGNQLKELPPTIFNGLNNMHRLYLDNNQLTQLPATLFQGLNNLEGLYLGNNQLTQLPTILLQGLNLTWLGLENNQLTQLPINLFHGLNNLQWLMLENNQLNDENKKILQDALPHVRIYF